MKIVFLDIFGVLNCKKSIKEFLKKTNNISESIQYLPDEFLLRLKKLIELTGAKIVVSANLRTDSPYNQQWVSFINSLKKYNLDLSVIGITPNINHPDAEKGDEIRKWLNDNKNINIDKFVIIDDDDDMNEFGDYLVQTSFETGFAEDIFESALQILN